MPRNFIILNGVTSLQIKGLLIQELPPITKPPIRFNAEEIDGVDGDRVERLGYGAYDKQLLIGLHGDFDVDEVIGFFDSSGEVVFSNEIDKYYRYEILQQIDFERLLRFRTATVTFHVQPFKYSSVERRVITAANQSVEIPDVSFTQNGVDVEAEDGVVTFYGENYYPIEVYIPIKPAVLQPGTYTLTVNITGQGMDGATMMLLDGSPTTEHAFGGQDIYLDSGNTLTLTAVIDGKRTFSTLYLVIPPNQTNFSFSAKMERANFAYIIRNSGNVFSKPIWTIYGSGQISLSLNGNQVMTVALGSEGHITIDCAALDAFKDTKTALKNRLCTGDYEDLFLPPGKNTLTWTGNVEKIEIEDYSRWR
ncbi:MAG: phage tail family protein [Firmicutes bacterium]|nr:phage tail family protein [Bacillota bacterium]